MNTFIMPTKKTGNDSKRYIHAKGHHISGIQAVTVTMTYGWSSGKVAMYHLAQDIGQNIIIYHTLLMIIDVQRMDCMLC